MSKVKDNWEEMSQEEILEEIHNENYGDNEQLRSDNEDLKGKVKDLEIEIAHWKIQTTELRKIIKTIEDRYSTDWEKQTKR